MTPIIAIVESTGYLIIAGIVVLVVGCIVLSMRGKSDQRGLVNNVSMPPRRHSTGDASELEMLIKDPSQRIAAIKLYREMHPGVGLAEAKAKVEELAKRSS